MKAFEMPTVDRLDFVNTEAAYTASGSVPVVPEEPKPDPKNDWEVSTEFRGHNSGSHSELAIIGHYNGSQQCHELTVDLAIFGGFTLVSVKDYGGKTITNVSPSGFSVTVSDCFNNGHNLQFNIQVVLKSPNGYVGAAAGPGGTESSYVPSCFKVVSYSYK